MKESELKPGQVAVNSHGCILVASNANDRPAVAVFDKDGKWLGGTYVLSAEKEVTPLLPPINLDELPRVTVMTEANGGFASAVLVSDLTGRCLTRSEGEGDKWQQEKAGLISRLQHARRKNRNYRKCVKDLNRSVEKNSVLSQLQAHRIIQRGNWVNEEREKVKQLQKERDTLTARVAELEASRRAYASEFPTTADGDPDVGSIHTNIRSMKAKLASLREQCVLESLSPKELKDYRGYVLAYRNEAYWVLFFWSDGYRPESGTVYFRWTPPVLPEPEPSVPVPAVPAYIRIEGVLGAIKKAGDLFVVLNFEHNGTGFRGCDLSNGAVIRFSLMNCTIYTGPVRHPDGTIAPIEPSKELIAALSGEDVKHGKVKIPDRETVYKAMKARSEQLKQESEAPNE